MRIVVKERLQMHTFSTDELIHKEGDMMDSLNVVLEGHVINYDNRDPDDIQDSNIYILKQNEVLALEDIPDIRLTVSENMKLKPFIL